MARPFDVLSVLVALEFVVVAAVVFLLVPMDAALAVVPLFLVFAVALLRYRS
jgi:hypothetical protein